MVNQTTHWSSSLLKAATVFGVLSQSASALQIGTQESLQMTLAQVAEENGGVISIPLTKVKLNDEEQLQLAQLRSSLSSSHASNEVTLAQTGEQEMMEAEVDTENGSVGLDLANN